MAEAPMKTLFADDFLYMQAFHLFLERSTEHQSMQSFINEKLPDIISRIGNGKPAFNVLGVGSGTGEMDMGILRTIKSKHPGVTINNEVVEPNSDHLAKYKELVASTNDLEKISFVWHEMTSTEYENQAKVKNECKKFDFIHMIQMLYYEKDLVAPIKFFQSCLEQNGKLLIIISADKCGWASLWKTYGSRLSSTGCCLSATCIDVEESLKRIGARYQVYDIPSEFDITEVFLEGNKNGDILLNFITETVNFRETAPPDLKAEVLNLIRRPECSIEKDGRIIFNSGISAIVVEP